MAITKVTRTLLSTGIVDNSNATAITIDSSENVGIGTTSPLAVLTSKNTGSLTTNSNDGDHTGFGLFLGKDTLTANTVNTAIGFGNTSSGRKYAAIGMQTYADADQNGLNFYVQSTASGSSAQLSEAMRIDNDGKVGIGTSSPSQKLDIGSGYLNFSNNYGIRWGGATSVALYGNQTSNFLAFQTSSSEKMRIDSSGNVGIGTSSPTNTLHILGTSNDTIDETKGTMKVQASGGNGMILGTIASAPFTSYIQSAYVQDTSIAQYNLALNPIGGNVGIGESSPLGKLHVKSADSGGGADAGADELVVEGSGDSGLSILSGASNNGTILFSDSGDSAAGGLRYEQSNNALNFRTNGAWDRLYINSSGKVGIGTSSPNELLEIKGAEGVIRLQQTGGAYADIRSSDFGTLYLNADAGNTASSSSMRFSVDAAEAMRIDSSQRVGIGLTSPSEKLHVYSGTGNVPAKFESGDAYSIIIFADNGSSGTVGIGAQSNDLIFYSGDAQRMRLSSGGVLAVDGAYNTTSGDAANVRVLSNGNIVRSTSSRRYKNTITDASKGLTELNNLRPVTYKGNNDGETVFYGLIAEEVHDAGLTEFVEYNDDNQPDAVRYPHMVSLCIKAIQEQQTIIDDLKTRIETLENA